MARGVPVAGVTDTGRGVDAKGLMCDCRTSWAACTPVLRATTGPVLRRSASTCFCPWVAISCRPTVQVHDTIHIMYIFYSNTGVEITDPKAFISLYVCILLIPGLSFALFVDFVPGRCTSLVSPGCFRDVFGHVLVRSLIALWPGPGPPVRLPNGRVPKISRRRNANPLLITVSDLCPTVFDAGSPRTPRGLETADANFPRRHPRM